MVSNTFPATPTKLAHRWTINYTQVLLKGPLSYLLIKRTYSSRACLAVRFLRYELEKGLSAV